MHTRTRAHTHTHTQRERERERERDSPLQSLPTYPGSQTQTPFVQFPLTHSGSQSLTVGGEGVGAVGYMMHHCKNLEMKFSSEGDHTSPYYFLSTM